MGFIGTRLGIIYGLMDPETLIVRYVGKTIQPLEKRFGQHLKATHTAHVVSWITSVKTRGLLPQIVVMEELPNTTAEQLNERECWWIFYGRLCVWDLTNLTDGGDGPGAIKEGSRTWPAKGTSKSPEHVAAMVAAKNKPEAIEANKKLHTGRKRSEETRARIGAKSKGRIPNEATRLKLSLAKQGRVVSEETRKKLSNAHKGKQRTPEHNAKLAASKRGKKPSQETRAKMSAGQKLRREKLRAEQANVKDLDSPPSQPNQVLAQSPPQEPAR